MKNISIGMRPTGHFTIEKRRKGEDAHWRTEFHNIVLDVGWGHLKDKLANGDYRLLEGTHLFLGSGTTEPQATDSGLESISGSLPGKAYTGIVYGGVRADRYPTARLQFDYGEGEAEGVWTELGLAFDSQYSRPYNRSLIRDENGNPISLTILSDEFLTVYVELGMYFIPQTTTGTFDYNGTQIGYTATMPSNISFYDDVNYFYNFWGRGLNPSAYYEGSSKEVIMHDNYNLPMTNVAGTLRWERNGDTYDPGVERVFSGFFCGPVHGITPQRVVDVDFDANVVIPSDHKCTWDGFYVEFFRDTVPAS